MKIVFLLPSCKKSGPVQQMLNIIRHLDRKDFEPYLVTVYPENDGESLLDLYKPYVQHYYAPTGKLDMVLGHDKCLRKTLDEIHPDVIHSLGAFPDYAVSRMKRWKHVITLRNYIYEDYPAKFGKLKGGFAARIHLYAMKHTSKTVTCSESLSKMYKERLGLRYDFIRNGVDIEQYTMPTQVEKNNIRKELNLPSDKFIFVYTGQMIKRKNVGFLLDTFKNKISNTNAYLLLLGGGPLLDEYKSQFGEDGRIDFRGNVSNVNHYLKACDAYVSTSFSEGLPNGVLEAMATGLPVVLSDIVQHLEIYDVNNGIGYVYPQGDQDELARRLHDIIKPSQEMGKIAYQVSHDSFSASAMSQLYQNLYRQL